MKTVFKKLIVACALPLVLTACGKDAVTDPAENAREAAKEPELQGKIFRGDCSLKPLDAIATGIATSGDAAIKSARVNYEFVGANVIRSTVLYGTSDCSGGESLIFNENGSFAIDTDKKSTDNGKYINLDFSGLSLLVVDENGAKVAQAVKLCGSSDWKAQTEKDVTAQAAEMTCYRQKLPRQDHNIFLVEDKTLYFGQRGALGSSTDRPTSLDRNTKYIAD